ncbi:hypothetical protein PSEUDO8Z_30146 [Pseudomonas sp. 8Z]|nr:hypothetical protein PSEUDO8Z_30146 [Pseudomonas sp. 8Z]
MILHEALQSVGWVFAEDNASSVPCPFFLALSLIHNELIVQQYMMFGWYVCTILLPNYPGVFHHDARGYIQSACLAARSHRPSASLQRAGEHQ